MTTAQFLQQARDRFKLAEEAEAKQRDREREDLKFYAGDQWSQDLLDSRKGITLGSGSNQQTVPARPSLTINKTREPVRQVLNQERQSDLGIELIPADDWGEMAGPVDHTEVELREGLVRRIQRDSSAADARTWAFARSAIAGRGYWLVMTRYVPGKTWDQEVYVDRIYDQNSVLLDPSHEQPDGSDAEWGFYGTDMLWSVYQSQHPDSKVSDIQTDEEWRIAGEQAPTWFSGEGEKRAVRVMNYYYTERTSRTLAKLEDGSAAWQDELPEGVTPVETRVVVEKAIKWCKINGLEILEQTDWPGHYLPIIKVVGEELQPYNNERRVEGIVRPMMDPCKGNNYIISKFVEQVGLTPIPPWMMAGGQDEGFEAEYQAATTRTIGVLHYNQKDNFGMPVAQPPFRTNVQTDVSSIAAGVEIFGRAIAATSVVPETALGNVDQTVKSGRLAKLLLEQADRGTSNFLDNLVRSMRHEARVINDLLYPIYGRPGRLARMMNGQGEMSAVVIGQPFRMEGTGKAAKPMPLEVPEGQPAPPDAKLYQLTPDAGFNVAIKIAKNYETRRQEIAQTLAEIISASPEQMAIIGDKLWKYFDLPDHEEIEKRYKVMLAPPVQALLDGQSPLPPEAQQKIAMLTEQLQQLAPLADKNRADFERVRLEKGAELEKVRLEIASKERIAESQNAVKLTDIEARINAAVAQAMIQWQSEQQAQARQQAHEQAMSGLEHAQTLEQADQAQGYALEQGAVGHQQALEQSAQQAALTPRESA